MDRVASKRRVATERQIKYANAMSKSLGLGVEFTAKSSFYDVAKFISNTEGLYKITEDKRVASQKQIDYANAIASICGINKFFKEGSLHLEVHKFIEENKVEYDKTIRKNNIENYVKDNCPFSTETMLYIFENLYKKHGLYCFLGEENEILYIGKSVDLSQRIPASYRERKAKAKIKKIMYYIEYNMADVNIMEILLISENKPALNSESNTDEIPERYKSGVDIFKNFTEIPYFGYIDGYKD